MKNYYYYLLLIILNKLIFLIFLKFLKYKVKINKFGIFVKDYYDKKDFEKIFINSTPILFYMIMYMILRRTESFHLAIFQLLPLYPLAMGKNLVILFSNFFGDINSLKIVKKISLFTSYLIIILGFITMIMFPYNLLFFIIGFTFRYINKSRYEEELMILDVIGKNIIRTKSKKIIWIKEKEDINDLINKIKINKYNIFIGLDMKLVYEVDLINKILS